MLLHCDFVPISQLKHLEMNAKSKGRMLYFSPGVLIQYNSELSLLAMNIYLMTFKLGLHGHSCLLCNL